ncbi:MAG: GNAT family N-acetyltransferase [Candidatus Solibacter sp.]
MNEPAELLEWDSKFFCRRIARVQGAALNQTLLDWCAHHKIDCLYYLAPHDPHTIAAAETFHFALTDIRVTYERPLANLPAPPADIRQARPADLERLKQIAAHSFTDSRFYADPHFGRAQCDALYAIWLERDFAEGRVLVAEHEGQPAGFVTCNYHGDTGNIGLIAVDAAAHGRGLGRRLVTAALHDFAAHGVTRSTVVTQARNIASQRLYQNCGYLLRSSALWYHRWFTS